MRAACKEVQEKLGITPLVLIGECKSNLVYIRLMLNVLYTSMSEHEVFAFPTFSEDSNTASINFFLQLGFTQQDEIVIWYGKNEDSDKQ